MSIDTDISKASQPETANLDNLANSQPEGPGGPATEIPRPALTLRQAAAILGKSLRTLERSLLGRWGNKLPDGWTARKLETDKGTEWRIIPPPGFRVRQMASEGSDNESYESSRDENDASYLKSVSDRRRLPWQAENQSLDHPTIVIDRSDEVEHLLRELLQTQKQLSEERRLRMEDLRLMTQMQSSMRLLEDRASETSKLKDALGEARQEFEQLKVQYIEVLNTPWWKRLFGK